MQREIDRRQQSLMKCENARSMRETSRTASGKRLKMGTDITINIGTKGVTKGPRLVCTNYVYVALLELILIGGYALVGCFTPQGKSEKYAPLGPLREYLAFVKKVALPLNRAPPPLGRVIRADEDTRALWAKHMRNGYTLGEAIAKAEAKQAAFWLWSCEDEAVEEIEAGEETNTKEETLGSRGHTPPAKRRRTASPTPPKGGPSGRGNTVAMTKTGKAFCEDWNLGKCPNGRCRNGEVHACNFRLPNGKACGSTSHRRTDMH